MKIETAYWFFEQFKDDSLCLLYNGSFSDKITSKFINLSEYNIKNNTELSKIKSRVSFLMAEGFQNIVRHGEINPDGSSYITKPGFFSIKNTGNIQFITSGNIVKKENVINLTRRIELVNSLDKEGLKQLYKKVINRKGFTEKGGAGLGIIEMGRKSSRKIDFSFKNFDQNHLFFYNQITLMPKAEEKKDTSSIKSSTKESVTFHQKMQDSNIFLIQKGDFSIDSIYPLLHIIKQNLVRRKDVPVRYSALHHVIFELLNNLGKHSEVNNNQNDGIFIIGKKDSNFTVSTGNYMNPAAAEKFKKELDLIKSLNKNELKKVYLQKLTDLDEENYKHTNVGLLNMARKCKEPIEFDFTSTSDGKVFFTINTVI